MQREWRQLNLHEKIEVLESRVDHAFDLVQSITSDLNMAWEGATASRGALGKFNPANEQVEPPPTAHAAPGGDRRKSRRQKNFLLGRLLFNNRDMSVECLIRDLSATGARVIVSRAVSVPSRVELELPQKNRRWQARVEWRRGDETGLSFVDAHSGPGVPSRALVKRVTELEHEVAALRGPIKTLTRWANRGRMTLS